MILASSSRFTVISLTLWCVAFASGAANAVEKFETATSFAASTLLPAQIVAGTNHRVRETVYNDGYLYIYTIDSKYGQLRAVSTAMLYKRIGELNAMAGMEKVRGTEEFKKGITGKAGDFVAGGVGVIKDPVGAVSGAVSGVASIFKSVGRTFKYGKSETESGRLSVISGFDKTKREYAAKFNVDVYSRNEHLQDELNKLTRAGFLGEAIVRLGTSAVGGAAGAALTVSGTTQALNELLRTKSAGDLRVLNEQTLKKIGVDASVIKLFLKNRNFTMTQQTALVLAVDSMAGVAKRDAFVKFAVLTDNPDMAEFRRRQAEMYADYSRNVKPIVAFEHLGQIATARTGEGAIVFNVPLDHMLWTSDLADFVRWVDSRVGGLPNVSRKEIIVEGTLSALTRKNIEQMGWQITERVVAR